VEGARIKEDDEYDGARVKFQAELSGARIPMQVDIGFGDAIYPEPELTLVSSAPSEGSAADSRVSARSHNC